MQMEVQYMVELREQVDQARDVRLVGRWLMSQSEIPITTRDFPKHVSSQAEHSMQRRCDRTAWLDGGFSIHKSKHLSQDMGARLFTSSQKLCGSKHLVEMEVVGLCSSFRSTYAQDARARSARVTHARAHVRFGSARSMDRDAWDVHGTRSTTIFCIVPTWFGLCFRHSLNFLNLAEVLRYKDMYAGCTWS